MNIFSMDTDAMSSGTEAILLFLAALVLLLVGHVMRLARWSILMRQAGHPRLGEGFMALTLGYVIDAVVPLRLGEIARGVYYARRTDTDTAFVLASIIVERTLDLIAVWALTMLLMATGLFGTVSIMAETLLTLGVAAVLALVAFATSRSARFRRMAWLSFSVFSPTIRVTLLDTLWSVVEVFRESRTRWLLIAVQSTVMWAFYMGAFTVLAWSLGIGLDAVFRATVASPLLPMVVPLLRQGGAAGLGMVVFSFAPLLLFLAYVGAKQQLGVSAWSAVSWMQDPRFYADPVPRSKSRFRDRQHYGEFLARRFNGTNDLVSDFEGNAIRDIVVQRMLRGGSDALTVMVQLRDKLLIRKYASGPAADKLEAQCAWLERHSNILPAVRIVERTRSEKRFLYDMEYSRTSRDLFDMVHMSDLETSWKTLADVMGTMSAFHSQTSSGLADADCTARYAREKVSANLSAIKVAAPEFFAFQSVRVNGVAFDLPLLDRFAGGDFVVDRLLRREVATIHGDLTIENILADPARPAGWFLIDPNVGNVFESPLLDYAKLMQSLHLGYESLNRDLSCSFTGGALSFPNTRSAQYASLYERTTEWLREHFGEDGLREIRLHEIVHYFRLTPYKFRKSTETGLVFLGCLCLLVKEYVDEYEAC